MLHTTRGIVFQTFSYTDTSVIAKIYTELFGLQSYLVSGAHSKRSGTKANLLQPLTLLECVVYKKEKKQLQRIKEIKCEHPFVSIPYDISKSAIALFLDELLYRSIREEQPDQALFEFIHSSLCMLDLRTESCANVHLYFMVQLSRYLGFYPAGNFSEEEAFFDLQEGLFKDSEPVHPLFLVPAQGRMLHALMNCTYGNLAALRITHLERKQLLEKLILYYELHLEALKGIRSHKVLEEIF
jgi:DNA repair protein RecO (recombination protein O)